MDDRPIWKTKTFWTALAGILAAIGAYFAGEITLFQLIEIEVIPFGMIFLRMGIRNELKE
jgi:hypothetical protein